MDQSIQQLIDRPRIKLHYSLEYELPGPLYIPVHEVAVVGTPTGFKTFHFRLSLVSHKPDGSSESIRIDMAPGDRYLAGVACLEYKLYKYSNNEGNTSAFVEELSPRYHGMTALKILEILFNIHNLDQYIFVELGAGCRHWCATALDTLAREGVIRNGVSDRFEDYERSEHPQHGDKFPMPRIKGIFY